MWHEFFYDSVCGATGIKFMAALYFLLGLQAYAQWQSSMPCIISKWWDTKCSDTIFANLNFKMTQFNFHAPEQQALSPT